MRDPAAREHAHPVAWEEHEIAAEDAANRARRPTVGTTEFGLNRMCAAAAATPQIK